MVVSSSTSWTFVIIGCTVRTSPVNDSSSEATILRKMSPVDITFYPRAASTFDCVPFPHPGGPNNITAFAIKDLPLKEQVYKLFPTKEPKIG